MASSSQSVTNYQAGYIPKCSKNDIFESPKILDTLDTPRGVSALKNWVQITIFPPFNLSLPENSP